MQNNKVNANCTSSDLRISPLTSDEQTFYDERAWIVRQIFDAQQCITPLFLEYHLLDSCIAELSK